MSLPQHAPFGPWPGPTVEVPLEAAPSNADVIVLGQGPGALAAALCLRRGGADVLVVILGDLAHTPGRFGAGILTLGIEDAPAELVQGLGGFGESILRDGAWALRRARAWMDALGVELQGEGTCRAAANPREAAKLKASLPVLGSLGLKARWVEPHGAQALVGLGAPRGGTLPWAGGVVLEAGGLFSPGACHDAFLRGALEAGVRFAQGGANPKLVTLGDAEGLRLGHGEVRGELILCAAGHLTSSLTSDYDAFFNPARLQGLQAPGPLAHESSGKGALGVMGFTANGGFEWGRCLPGGGYLLGGYRYMDVELAMGPTKKGESLWNHPRIRGRQEAVLDAAWPAHPAAIAALGREITLGCDNLPIVGPHPGEGRRHLLLGLGGHDVSLGIGAGEAIARGILGASPDHFSTLGLRRML